MLNNAFAAINLHKSHLEHLRHYHHQEPHNNVELDGKRQMASDMSYG